MRRGHYEGQRTVAAIDYRDRRRSPDKIQLREGGRGEGEGKKGDVNKSGRSRPDLVADH